MKVEIFQTIGNSLEQDAEWNELLNNSRYGTAVCRTEVMASFQANFAPAKQLAAVVVRDTQGSLVAGLPLIFDASSRLFSSVASVSNEWCQCGQLLLAKHAEPRSVLSSMLDGLSQLRAHSFWLDWIPDHRPEWQLIIQLAQQRGWGCQTKSKFEVGVTQLPSSWSDFENSLSRNARKRARSELKKLSQDGNLRLEIASDCSPVEMERALQNAFEIEMRSWKGHSGTAIACHANVRAFYLEMALALHSTGNFRLFLLRWNDQPIAFDLGEQFLNSYRSWKVSFLPEFANYSPGHVLNQLVLRHFIEETSIEVCDSVGPMTEAIQRWTNDHYRLGRMVLAPGSWISNVPGRSLVSTLALREAMRRRTAPTSAST